MAAAAAGTDQGPDWLSLPTALLQHVICLSNTWQVPGSCLVASVCRTWRSAAAWCKVTHLLYLAGHPASDQSFALWLGRNSQQLEALTLSSDSHSAADLVLGALAQAAEAAAAAGRPLNLHTLRVLGCSPFLDTVGQLLARLPCLRTLQLAEWERVSRGGAARKKGAEQLQQALASLQTAPQLQELYLRGPPLGHPTDVAERLPPGLKRLSWQAHSGYGRLPDLSHQTQLTFLQLLDWGHWGPTRKVPPSVRELHLCGEQAPPQLLPQQQQVVAGVATLYYTSDDLSRLPALSTVSGTVCCLHQQGPASQSAVLAQLPNLSAVRLTPSQRCSDCQVERRLRARLGLPGLRRLELPQGMPPPADVSDMTALTRLVLSLPGDPCTPECKVAWAEELGSLSGLRWLSLPYDLLVSVTPSLHRLQQLQVLVVVAGTGESPAFGRGSSINQAVRWLKRNVLPALPHSVHLLGLSSITAQQASAWRLRPGGARLQQLSAAAGCEVVVGVVLDEVADPTQQLAGLPLALQQALA